MYERIEKPVGKDRREDEGRGTGPGALQSSIVKKGGCTSECRPGNAGQQAMGVGKDEVRLMGACKVGGDNYGLPAKKNKEPEHEVNKDGGRDEDTDVDASLQPA
jgi:hypothetical protein